MKTSQHDWKHSKPLDLTDEGILKDMEKHGAKGVEELAVAKASGKKAKK